MVVCEPETVSCGWMARLSQSVSGVVRTLSHLDRCGLVEGSREDQRSQLEVLGLGLGGKLEVDVMRDDPLCNRASDDKIDSAITLMIWISQSLVKRNALAS